MKNDKLRFPLLRKKVECIERSTKLFSLSAWDQIEQEVEPMRTFATQA